MVPIKGSRAACVSASGMTEGISCPADDVVLDTTDEGRMTASGVVETSGCGFDPTKGKDVDCTSTGPV